MADNPFEIPQSLREVSEQNLNQAHAAYEQFLDFFIKTADAWITALPQNPLTAGFKEVQSHALEIAKENAKSAFAHAGKISSAQTLQELVTLQTQFTQDRIQAFIAQTQQFYSSVVEAFQKSEHGALSGVTNVTAPIPQGVSFGDGFKDVQNRAVAMAKNNAETAFAVAEKIGKAQNLQEIFTLQSRYAQDQIQAFASEAQELQKLIGDAVRKFQNTQYPSSTH